MTRSARDHARTEYVSQLRKRNHIELEHRSQSYRSMRDKLFAQTEARIVNEHRWIDLLRIESCNKLSSAPWLGKIKSLDPDLNAMLA
ncbi:hypothetical protein D9M68_744570 [compost metagenome]